MTPDYYIQKVPTMAGMRYYVTQMGRKIPGGYGTEEKALIRLQELQDGMKKWAEA